MKKKTKENKKIEIVIPKDEKKGIIGKEDEIDSEKLEDIITKINTEEKPNNFKRRKFNDVNPSLEQSEILLENALSDVPLRRINEGRGDTEKKTQSNSYLSSNDQNNLYSETNLYSSNNNINSENSYQSIAGGISNITSIENQRKNKGSINDLQKMNFHNDSEFQKTPDIWGFDDINKNVSSIEESQKKEKQKRDYQ